MYRHATTYRDRWACVDGGARGERAPVTGGGPGPWRGWILSVKGRLMRTPDSIPRMDYERVRETACDLLVASAGVSPPSIEEAYVLPQFGDWPFAFARIDGVYVWTQGGYQVGRDPDDYPLFLAVREQDVEAWQDFFERFGLPTAFERQPREGLDGPLQIVLDPRLTLEVDHVDGYPVVPREETVAYMREHYGQFQSALSMLDRMYDDLDLDVSYRESEQSGSSVSDVTDGIDGAR